MTARLLVAALALVVTGACGGGSDTLARVIGPNPISDTHDLVDRVTQNGWTDAQRGDLREQWRIASDDAYTIEEDDCVVGYLMDHFTPGELADAAETMRVGGHQEGIAEACF